MSNQNKQKTSGGGFFIAILSIIGVFAGGFMGQPSIGLLAGFALGVMIAILLWLKETRG